MIRSRRALVALILLVAFGAAACSEDNKVGSGVDTDIEGQSGARLGETTSTLPPEPTTAAPAPTTAPVATTAAPPRQAAPVTAAPTTAPPTTAAAPTPTTQRAVQVFEVAITSTGFEPSNVRVFTGQQVRYTNKDEQTRSVKAGDGSFNSGDLAPGASWTFSTNQAGRYDITDGTRPFVVGSIEVLQR